MTRSQEKALRQAASAHGRHKSGLSLCEGVRCCRELLLRHPETVELLLLAENRPAAELLAPHPQLSCPVHSVPEGRLAEFASTAGPQGVLVLFRSPEIPPLRAAPPDPFLLVVDGVADPGNLGTILRTAWAVGLRRVCLVQGGCDPYSPKGIRAGMGAQFALELVHSASLDDTAARLSVWGWGPLWLAVPRGGVDAFGAGFALDRSALVIGGEAGGVSEPEAGPSVSLPMPGDAESLNAAQAATVFLFDAVRRGLLGQRRAPSGSLDALVSPQQNEED